MTHPLRDPRPWLALSALSGVGAKRGLSIARRWIKEGTERPLEVEQGLWRGALEEGMRLLARCERAGVEVAPYGGERYPPLLRLIPSPPLILFMKGRSPEAVPQLACVGTRSPSAWGLGCATEVAQAAVEEGYGVTSGLALGVDGRCHEACLAAGGATWAVLGCGHERLSPRRHEALAERLLAQGGGLVSEYPPELDVHPGRLVARDRLQSGLSLATLVIESGVDGGAMHAGRAALRQRRALWVPQSPAQISTHPKHLGLQRLREEGAVSLEHPRGLREALIELSCEQARLSQRGEALRAELWEPTQPRLL